MNKLAAEPLRSEATIPVINAGALGRVGRKRRKVEAGIHANQSLAMGLPEYMLTDLAGGQQIDGGLAGSTSGWGNRRPRCLPRDVRPAPGSWPESTPRAVRPP